MFLKNSASASLCGKTHYSRNAKWSDSRMMGYFADVILCGDERYEKHRNAQIAIRAEKGLRSGYSRYVHKP